MGGGFIEKKLVVDEKQTEQSCSFTLKKIMSKTSSSSLSMSYIGVGQILMGCSKKKNVLFSGGFGCLLWVLGSGV